MKRIALPALALTALCVLSVIPATGWLVRQQLQVALGGGLDRLGLKWLEQQDEDGGAAERSGDPKLLLAATRNAPEKLRALAKRFPQDPVVCATLVESAKEALGGAPQPDGKTPWTPGADSTKTPGASLQALMTDCAHGEAIAPDNAFFPTFHAFALFAAGRPQAAVAKLHEAAQKPRWDSYSRARVEAAWALDKAAHGESGVTGRIAHLAIAISTDFPPLAQLRQVARSAAAYASGREKAGQEREALTIREDLLKLGYRIQTDGTQVITNLVGGSMSTIALGPMGGQPIPPPTKDYEKRLRLYREGFQRQATRLGRPELAALAERQQAEQQQLKKTAQAYFDSGRMLENIERAFVWQGAALIALLGVLWTILFGGIASGLARTERIRRRERMHPAVGWGLLLGMSVPPLVAFGLETFTSFGGALLGLGTVLVFLAGFFLRKQALRNAGIVALTVVSVLGLAGVSALLLNGPAVFTSEASHALVPTEESSSETMSALLGLVLGALSLAIPLLTIFGLAIAGWVKRVPASVQVVKGFRRGAIPAASLVLLVYGALVTVAANLDARERDALAEQIKHEARYYAKVSLK